MGQRQRAIGKDRWAHLYKTARWQRIRAAQLTAMPLCAYCLEMGRTTAATVCDHVTPHKGDEGLFYGGPFQSLCKPCHDGVKAEEEARGYRKGCDASGAPLDAPPHWR